MRRVREERAKATAKATRPQRETLERFGWTRVAAVIAERLGVPGHRRRQ